MRKGDISINIIIIAAIALIVLVVLIAIFSGRMGKWGVALDEVTNKKCSDVGGEEKYSQDCEPTKVIYGQFQKLPSGKVCCKTA